jgi:hypothetical protein
MGSLRDIVQKKQSKTKPTKPASKQPTPKPKPTPRPRAPKPPAIQTLKAIKIPSNLLKATKKELIKFAITQIEEELFSYEAIFEAVGRLTPKLHITTGSLDRFVRFIREEGFIKYAIPQKNKKGPAVLAVFVLAAEGKKYKEALV